MRIIASPGDCMESVGSQLRQARLSQGVTFEQISAKTRISLRNLQAIENDDLSRINSAFFYRSFVKQFAEQLKLDYNSLATAVGEAAGAIPEPLMPGQISLDAAEAPLAKLPRLRMRGPKNHRWLYSLLSFCIMLAACSSFYGAWQQSRSNWRALTALISFLTPGTRSAHMAPIQQSIAPFADLGEAAMPVAVNKPAAPASSAADKPESSSSLKPAAEPAPQSAPVPAHRKLHKHSRRHRARR